MVAATRTDMQIGAAGMGRRLRGHANLCCKAYEARMWRVDVAELGRATVAGHMAAWADREECWAANAGADRGASCGGAPGGVGDME